MFNITNHQGNASQKQNETSSAVARAASGGLGAVTGLRGMRCPSGWPLWRVYSLSPLLSPQSLFWPQPSTWFVSASLHPVKPTSEYGPALVSSGLWAGTARTCDRPRRLVLGREPRVRGGALGSSQTPGAAGLTCCWVWSVDINWFLLACGMKSGREIEFDLSLKERMKQLTKN